MLDRTKRPDFTVPKYFEFPKVEVISPLFFGYNTSNVPLIKIDLVYQISNSSRVICQVLGKMLLEGTKTKSSSDIHEFIARYGAHVEIKPGFDLFTVTLYTQKQYSDLLINFLSELLFDSTFPDNELKKVKSIEQQNLQVNNEKNSFVASNEFRTVLHGSKHRYGEVIIASDIDLINNDQLRQHYKTIILQNAPEVYISGDYSNSDCDLLKSLFQKTSVINNSIHTDVSSSNKKKHLLPREEAVQSSLRIGRLSIDRKHEDFIDLVIANEVLGGYFGSRLMKNIREDKGLTYGIYSQCPTLAQSSHWVIGADVKKDLVNLALDEIYKEIDLLISEGVDQEEIQVVSNYMAGSFLSSINTQFDIMDKFKMIHRHGLTYDYYKTFYDRLSTISSEDIQRVSKAYFQDTFEVVVG